MKSWLKRRWFALTCVFLGAVLLGSAGLQVGDRLDLTQGQYSLGIGQKVITLGYVAYAAGATDYVYDGADDDVQFQAALDALPATGGRLVNVSAVQINFSAVVSRAIDNVIIEGSGAGTYFANNGVASIFSAGAQSDWHFKNFSTDAGGVDISTATNSSLENITIGATYWAYDTTIDIGGASWDIPSGRGATLIVAASDSYPNSAAQADYVCDGTNDEVQIQAAIDALPAGGGKVSLSEGIFNLGADINLVSGTHLSGQGISTHLISQVEIAGIKAIGTVGTPLANIEVSGLYLEGFGAGTANNRLKSAMYYEYIDNLTVRNCKVTKAVYDAILIISVVDGKIIGNHIEGGGTAGDDGINTLNDCDGIIIDSNYIDGITNDGIHLPGGLNIVVSNNVVKNSGQNGMLGGAFQSSFTGIFANNTVINSAQHSLQIENSLPLTYSVNAIIVGNNLQDSGGIGIMSPRNNTTLSIVGNKIINATSRAIEVVSDIPAYIVDNRIDDCATLGIRLDAPRSLVDGNRIENMGTNEGIQLLANSDYSVVSNNVVRSVGGAGIYIVAGATDTVILNNNITSAVAGNIVDVAPLTNNTNIRGNIGYIASGENRSASGSLTAGNANAIAFAWNNPELQDIIIKKVVIEVTTSGGTAGSHLDVGIADDAAGTNRGVEFFDDLLLNNVLIYDSWLAGDAGTQTKWVVVQDSVSAIDDWIVGQILDANAASLVGTYYIEYVGR